MPVVVLVLDQGRTIFGNAHVHEFADDAAEICRHQKAFQPGHSLCVQLLIDETQEADQVIHGPMNVFCCQSVRQAAFGVEQVRLDG